MNGQFVVFYRDPEQLSKLVGTIKGHISVDNFGTISIGEAQLNHFTVQQRVAAFDAAIVAQEFTELVRSICAEVTDVVGVALYE